MMFHDLITTIKNRIAERSVAENKGRYERKFVVTGLKYQQILSIIKHHPAFFREIFRQRQINNIYLDTPDLKSFFDNVYGNTHRTKIRIRWYGETFGPVNKPVLEMKIKSGLAGRKRSYALNPFMLDTSFDRDSLHAALAHPRLPAWVTEKLSAYVPALLNTYKRQYFLSANRKMRLTVDEHMTYYAIGAWNNTFVKKYVEREAVIVEMKYDLESAYLASDITQHFPMRMTKSSKYVNGVEIFNPQLAL